MGNEVLLSMYIKYHVYYRRVLLSVDVDSHIHDGDSFNSKITLFNTWSHSAI